MCVESLIAIHSERNIPLLEFSSVNSRFGQEKVSQFIRGQSLFACGPFILSEILIKHGYCDF